MFAKVLAACLVALVAWAVMTRASSGAGPREVYVVRPTDTLWAIAVAHYAGDPREGVWLLERRNHLSGAAVTPGERLVLP